MGTILSSQSQADSAADVVSSAFAFLPEDVVTPTIVNPTPGPNQGGTVVLELSSDNVNWFKVDRRLIGYAAGQTYSFAFNFTDYVALYLQYGASGPWLYFRVRFTAAIGAAQTIAATDGDGIDLAIVTLAGTTATTGGAIGSWLPPEGGTVVILPSSFVLCTVNSTGAANLTAGVATNATTSATNLITATALAAAANTAIGMAGGPQALTGVKAVTFTGSADTTGFAGKAYIYYAKS